MRKLAASAIIVTTAYAAIGQWSALAADRQITTFPQTLSKDCRYGRAKIYDECSNQSVIFDAAAKQAAAENKVLLVSFGAEWCIWCHVFEKYVHGGKTRFEYTYAFPEAPDLKFSATLYEREVRDVTEKAARLKEFVSRSFVVVNIDAQFAPNGESVLQKTGADQHDVGGLPFIFSVDRNGRFAARFDHDRVELRRDTEDWYRGYDRERLLAHLKELHAAAVASGRN